MHPDKASFDGQFIVQMIPPANQLPYYNSGGTWETFTPTTSEPPDPVYGGCSSCGQDVPDVPK
jgi:hypothetical protein